MGHLHRVAPASGIGLGIDTGGTFTDAVLVDHATGRVLAKAKALTTPRDLSAGIGEAIGKAMAVAPSPAADVCLVSLSTTLATNALVGGHGTPVAALLIGFGRYVSATDLATRVGTPHVSLIGGGHDTSGQAIEDLDEGALRAAIAEHAGHVAAFAVSGYFGSRNPAHEIAARRLVRDMTGLPCTCGHELTHRLDAVRRAMTSVLNASLISLICDLLTSVERSLARHGVTAPLMVVKGDGSLMGVSLARERPIETVLSGPAASVVGATHLTGAAETVVVDMGGTTTDVAVVSTGVPRLDPRGARVGGWRTMVEAIDVHTAGLGGDSSVTLSPQGTLALGPRRAIPLCLLGSQFPVIREALRLQLSVPPKPGQGEFYVMQGARWDPYGEAPPFEHELRQRLADGPVAVSEALRICRYPTLYEAYFRRLEREGVLVRSSLTPTDAAHVLGLYLAWDAPTSLLGAELVSRRVGLDPHELSHRIMVQVSQNIARHVVRAVLDDGSASDAADGHEQLIDLAIDPHPLDRVACRLELRPPLTAIGAPVGAYLPRVASLLGTRLTIPEHAEVANALGAIVGSIASRVQVSIEPASHEGALHVYTPDGVAAFGDLEGAASYAIARAREIAIGRARQAGAGDIVVHVRRDDRYAPVGDGWGEKMLVQSEVEVTATGRPRLGMLAHDAPVPPTPPLVGDRPRGTMPETGEDRSSQRGSHDG